jgi:hypothetical protein
VDGRLCLWDSYLLGNVNAPIAVLKHDSEYPIYAVDLSKNCVAVGGGSEGGFVGVPLNLYSFISNEPRVIEECTISRMDDSECIASTKTDDSGGTEDDSKPDGNTKASSEAREEVSNDTNSASGRSIVADNAGC